MANFEPFTFEKAGNLKGKTLFITGASRGIGFEIGLRAAKDGANVVIAAIPNIDFINSLRSMQFFY